MHPFIADLGAPELLILLVVLVLLFGASKLPELARGSGQALRIFKAETREITSDTPTEGPVDADGSPPVAQPAVQPARHTDKRA